MKLFIVILVFKDIIDSVFAFDNHNRDKAITIWEEFTIESWSKFAENRELLLKTDFESSNVLEVKMNAE